LPGPDTVGRSPTTRPEQDVLKGYQPVLGDYDLLHVAGEGGMGVVFQARFRPTGRIVALKILRPGLSLEPDLVARFRREIRIADVLRHPHIATVTEVGDHNGRLYYTMPYAPTNLYRQRQRYAEPHAAARIMVTIARAVHHAHVQGIIHRDLKPNNILLTAAHEPLVADFGLARWMDASQQLTQFGDLMGTPAYMAPEQAAGPSDQLGPAADVWSLGVILYELVAGQRPFEGGDTNAMLHMVRTAEPPLPRQFRPDIDLTLEAVILKCLRKKPTERYATAAAFADDLQRWLDGTPVRAPVRPQVVLSRPAERAARPQRYVAVGLLMAIASVLMLGGLWGGSSTDATERHGAPKIDWTTPFPSQDRLDWVTRELAARRQVDLVVGRSTFRWFQRVYDSEPLFAIRPAPESRGVRVTHSEIGMATLVPNPPSDHYSVAARIVHVERAGAKTFPAVGAGVYFGYGATGEGPNRMEYCVCWTFNDLDDDAADLKAKIARGPGEPPLPDGNRLLLESWLFDTKRQFAPGGRLNNPGWNDRFIPARRNEPGTPAPRLLYVEVEPDNVTVWFDNRRVGQVSLAVMNQSIRNIWVRTLRRSDPPPVIDPRGSLGVFVRRSTAVVQSFLVTPLETRSGQ
jgi:hypothetical protein